MATHEHAPIGGRLVTGRFIFLLLVIFVAAVVLTQRFVFGLGATTNLSDGYPWGIWIAIDLIIGTALGCGGFVMAFLVYILNKGEYHPLARAGLMTSLFGYSLGGLAVMFDLGRYWQGYNIMLPWLVNTNSVLLETALCIFAYILVLMVEFAPSVLERFGMTDARRKLHKVLFVFTGLGVLLPMMHQSSMGTVVVLLGYKLSPLWQSSFLTFFFLITAISMGFAVVVFESDLVLGRLRAADRDADPLPVVRDSRLGDAGVRGVQNRRSHPPRRLAVRRPHGAGRHFVLAGDGPGRRRRPLLAAPRQSHDAALGVPRGDGDAAQRCPLSAQLLSDRL